MAEEFIKAMKTLMLYPKITKKVLIKRRKQSWGHSNYYNKKSPSHNTTGMYIETHSIVEPINILTDIHGSQMDYKIVAKRKTSYLEKSTQNHL